MITTPTLSAPAIALLRDPRQAPDEVLKLALKELVLRGVWSLERRPTGIARRRRVHFVIGDAEPPESPPLACAHRALRRVVGWDGREVRQSVRMMLFEDDRLAKRVREDARDELAALGLARVERSRALGVIPRTRVELTPEGRAASREAPGELSVLFERRRGIVGRAVRRARRDDVGTTGWADSDLDDIDLLDALDAGFDEGADDSDAD